VSNLAERARRLNRGAKTGFALFTDERRIADPLPLLPLLAAGSLVVLRHYGLRGRTTLARKLARACRARRLVLLIADDLSLAATFGAGLHLPERRARDPGARIRLWHRRTGRPLTAAAHGRDALERAAAAGADLAFLSPVFATASHPGAAGLGALRFRVLTRKAPLPVWALGGIAAKTLRRVRGSGAAGIATVGNLT
jgi:thiamine-phosphate pyrophosphorylase